MMFEIVYIEMERLGMGGYLNSPGTYNSSSFAYLIHILYSSIRLCDFRAVANTGQAGQLPAPE